MIGSKDPQDILNPQKHVRPETCKSSHGTKGFLQGTTYDKQLGRFVCPCGRQYTSNLDKPDWVQENAFSHSQINHS
jgi:hypothetical protein